ncbi:MAG TPA: hypothetical protein VN828_06975 [Acidobacteriaceae bacterium]|jgi:hypothetical protein|nr:hypothetical protein [Acidobacteriaceae bacterium]
MSEPTPLSLSHHFTNLVGRKVTFAPTTIAPETKIKQMYGIYNVLPHETAIVVKADLPLLGSLAGVLVGLPDSAVKECLAKSPLEELLRDAIHEVLNVASTVVTNEGRAVFTRMVTDTGLIDGTAGQLFKKPDRRTYFNVLVDGYQGGKFTIFAQFQPVKTVNV